MSEIIGKIQKVQATLNLLVRLLFIILVSLLFLSTPEEVASQGPLPKVANKLPDNLPSVVTMDHCGELPGNQIWHANDNVHVLTCDVIVPYGITLTIETGAIIKPQNGDISLIVDGTLNANGTQANPIYFTSYHDDTIGGNTDGIVATPAPGDWHSIYFRNNSSGNLTYARLRYGGDSWGYGLAAMLQTEAASVSLDHTTFSNSPFCAIAAIASHDVTMSNMSPADFTNNAVNAQCIWSGSLTSDTTWDETEVPYVPYGNLTIAFGSTLTWAPGVIIKPLNGDTQVIVDGTLIANGSETSPVYVTSFNDDTLGGNTNNSTATASIGDWDSINFRNGSSGNLSHIEVRYGGDSGGSRAALHVENASPNITYCGLRKNVRGVSSSGASANPAIHNCVIAGNTEFGVFNATSGHWIDARNNWWGNNSGPYDPSPPGTDGDYNQTGSGDRVNDYVTYRPWTVLIYYYLPLLTR